MRGVQKARVHGEIRIRAYLRLIGRALQLREHIGRNTAREKRIVGKGRRLSIHEHGGFTGKRGRHLPGSVFLHIRNERRVDGFVADTMRQAVHSVVDQLPGILQVKDVRYNA